MFKSPRKNVRNKGVKIKHVIQISLLLGVSIWLIYQIHHSDGKNPTVTTKISHNSNNDSSKDILKLGRKVLRPKVKETKADDEQNNANEGSEDVVEDHESDDHEEVGENEHADGKEDSEEIKEDENKKENEEKGHEQVVVMENTEKKLSPDMKDVKMSLPSKNEYDSKKQSAKQMDSAPGSYSYETKAANYMKSTRTEKNIKDGSEQKEILEEEKDALTDLETLPESGTGGSINLEN